MSDRELLELAAKAAGIKIEYEPYAGDGESDAYVTSDGYVWNPLTDDGDALRLAVRLKIDTMHTNVHAPQVHAMTDYEVACIEDSNGDPYAATRRAIVRAAAEIGRTMP